MKGTIVNFRLSRHRQKNNHMVIKVASVTSRKKAMELVGKKVVFKTDGGKDMNGTVASAHGNSGAVRAIFETGMPGQSVGKSVDIV
jgi:large subunit ribosomal protein L35Ae